jgi:hypothetical protein
MIAGSEEMQDSKGGIPVVMCHELSISVQSSYGAGELGTVTT